MADSASASSDSLIHIPDDISVKFLPNASSLSEKVLQKGLNYFTQGYIHEIKVNRDADSVRVYAKCWRSMRKSQAPHALHIDMKDSLLSESYCTCKVGLPEVSATDIHGLKSMKGTPLELTMSEDHPTVDTPMGEVQIGSLLTYQTRNIKEVCPVESEGCGDTNVHREPPVALPAEYPLLNEDCDPVAIERGTIDQADSQLWVKKRENRLTASNFGKVLNRKSAPNEKVLKNIFLPKKVIADSLEYGKRNEQNAKAKYLEENPSRHFHKCGLVVSEKLSFLGASPDGKLCDNGAHILPGILQFNKLWNLQETSF